MFKSRKNRNHKPIKKMNADQQRIIRALHQALQEADYDTARNLVTKVQDLGHKKQGYKEIVNLACRQGNVFRMMEVAPFRGFQLTEEEIRDCLEWAMKDKDIRNAVQCKRMLGEKFTVDEAIKFRRPTSSWQADSDLLDIILKYVSLQDMLPEEVLTVQMFEIDVSE